MGRVLRVRIQKREEYPSCTAVDRGCSLLESAPVWPDPLGDFREIISVSPRPRPGLVPTIDHGLPGAGGLRGETRNPIDHVGDDVVTIEVVHHHHVERCCRGALLVIART